MQFLKTPVGDGLKLVEEEDAAMAAEKKEETKRMEKASVKTGR